MKPISVSFTLSEMSRDRMKICCDIKYRLCEERDSLMFMDPCMAEPLQRPATKNVCKTRDRNYSFELLIMDGVSSETC